MVFIPGMVCVLAVACEFSFVEKIVVTVINRQNKLT